MQPGAIHVPFVRKLLIINDALETMRWLVRLSRPKTVMRTRWWCGRAMVTASRLAEVLIVLHPMAYCRLSHKLAQRQQDARYTEWQHQCQLLPKLGEAGY